MESERTKTSRLTSHPCVRSLVVTLASDERGWVGRAKQKGEDWLDKKWGWRGCTLHPSLLSELVHTSSPPTSADPQFTFSAHDGKVRAVRSYDEVGHRTTMG